MDPDLAELAAAHGVATSYRGEGRRRVEVDDDVVVRVLGLLDVDAATTEARTAALAAAREKAATGALPGILAGFRITSSIALILLVAAEMIGAEQGIGAFVLQAGQLMQTDQLLAGVVVLSLLGLVVGTLLSRLERRFTAWR